MKPLPPNTAYLQLYNRGKGGNRFLPYFFEHLIENHGSQQPGQPQRIEHTIQRVQIPELPNESSLAMLL